MPNKHNDDTVARIFAALERDPHVNRHRWPIEVTLEGQRIVLEGTVGDIAAKRSCVNTARHVTHHRHELVDRLRVSAPAIEDLALRDQVASMLTKEPVFKEYTLVTEAGGHVDTLHDAGPHASSIHASIRNNVVTLTGRVGSLTHRRLAEVLVWWTEGCQAVDNHLVVDPPEEDADNEITDAVRMVLEKDPTVPATQLRVGTAGGVVDMEGLVATDEEKKMAVLDAWYVPGVWDVIDRIEVQR